MSTSFSNKELGTKPKIAIGDTITCPRCGGHHTLRGGKNAQTGEETDTILYYLCGDKAYLAAVTGRLVAS